MSINPSHSRSDYIGRGLSKASSPRQLTSVEIKRMAKFPPINELPVNYIDTCVGSVEEAEQLQHRKMEPLIYIEGMKENTTSEEPDSDSSLAGLYVEGVRSPQTSTSYKYDKEPQVHAESPLGMDQSGELGSGSYGSIRKGSFEREGKEKAVAIKSFKSQKLDRELKVIESLMRDNPRGSVRLYGKMHHDDGKEHIIMKYCNQGTVGTFFEKSFMSKSLCYQKVLSLLKVVKDFHESGFCHRDLHEENFLVHQKKNGATQDFLVDFGHAGKVGGESSEANPLKGREMFLMNSPLEVSDLFFEVWEIDRTGNGLTRIGSSDLYDEFADHHAFAIDRYQLGFMLFRVCCLVEYGTPLVMGLRNVNQKELYQKMRSIKKEIDGEHEHLKIQPTELKALKVQAFREKMNDYMALKFSKVPSPIAHVIVGLLNFPQSMSLQEAIQALEAYMATQDLPR
jgi:tRNA A-37 threonylcarbamoyl transferase component Bud32